MEYLPVLYWYLVLCVEANGSDLNLGGCHRVTKEYPLEILLQHLEVGPRGGVDNCLDQSPYRPRSSGSGAGRVTLTLGDVVVHQSALISLLRYEELQISGERSVEAKQLVALTVGQASELLLTNGAAQADVLARLRVASQEKRKECAAPPGVGWEGGGGESREVVRAF